MIEARKGAATLVANSPQVAADLLRRHMASSSACAGRLLVGVDGGAATLLALGLVPDIVTGDFDSLPPAVRDDLAARGARIVPTPDQNYTDLDKALDYARNGLDAQHIRVFGATGGRLDHTYSALSALLKHGRHDSTRPKADIRLVDDVGETLVVNDTLTLTGPDLPGRTLSLMALGPVSGIWTTGVRWPLFGESLAPGVRDGTLNVVTETTVQVRAGSGDLLVLLHHVAAERAETTYGARPVSPP